ncbi:MAG: T9SS type A sorting domain-containing protein, partial [Cyclobacteriaceae bacterium]
YDKDGDLDIIICGDRGNAERTILYTNKLIDNPVTGLKGELAKIYISPNPVTNILNIDLSNGYPYSIAITELTGKTLLEETAKGRKSIDIEHLSPGLYIVTVIHKKSIQREKILKVAN